MMVVPLSVFLLSDEEPKQANSAALHPLMFTDALMDGRWCVVRHVPVWFSDAVSGMNG